jgi:hypothetical protein
MPRVTPAISDVIFLWLAEKLPLAWFRHIRTRAYWRKVAARHYNRIMEWGEKK